MVPEGSVCGCFAMLLGSVVKEKVMDGVEHLLAGGMQRWEREGAFPVI